MLLKRAVQRILRPIAIPAPRNLQNRIHTPVPSSSVFSQYFRFYTMKLSGGCYCRSVRFEVEINEPDTEARTSICHCKNCRKWTGSAYGITTKLPRSAFRVVEGKTKEHVSDNGSGTKLYREFCETCGSGILEYGENAGENTYICYGAFDEPEKVPPKGEFFCKYRASWQPEIPGAFHKQEIKK